MQETEEYEQFLENVMKNDEMLLEMAKDPASFQVVIDKINELNNNRIPGGDFFKLGNKVVDQILIKEEVAANFSDEDMLKIYKSYFDKWFALEGFKDSGAGFNNPIFAAIQQAFTTCAKLDHVLSMQYLFDHVKIEDYDIDALDMLIAIKGQRKYVLELMWLYADKEKYGFTGSLTHIIGPQLRTEFHNQKWMPVVVKNKLSDFKILQS